ncbi:MAG TPA: CBS domain-containing protein [Rectinemataceae bacterium]|nr:CBS domain-containing protein [Rectinemataceae bacterium]
MPTVRSLLGNKEHETTFAVGINDPVLDALKAMAAKDVGAILVRDGEKYVGIFTERDYARKGEVVGKTASTAKMKDVMTPKIITVSPDATVEECMGLMLKYRIRHLPVTEGTKIVGLVSMRDVVGLVLEDKENVIAGLQNIMMGSSFTS